VQEQDRVGDITGGIPLRGANGRVTELQLWKDLTAFEFEVTHNERAILPVWQHPRIIRTVGESCQAEHREENRKN
jgi:hypothetical protein